MGSAHSQLHSKQTRRFSVSEIGTAFLNSFDSRDSITEISGLVLMIRATAVMSRNWASYTCCLQLANGECVEVRNLEPYSRVSTVMEQVRFQEIYVCGRLLHKNGFVSMDIPRGAVLRFEPRTYGRAASALPPCCTYSHCPPSLSTLRRAATVLQVRSA